MSNRTVAQDVFDALEEEGVFVYGSVIPTEKILKLADIEYPEMGTREEYQRLSLQELTVTDYIRNILLGRGMYFTKDGESYRIALPSENQTYIQGYISAADKKLNRALKLSRNTPTAHAAPQDQTVARIIMKQEGVRNHRMYMREQPNAQRI